MSGGYTEYTHDFRKIGSRRHGLKVSRNSFQCVSFVPPFAPTFLSHKRPPKRPEEIPLIRSLPREMSHHRFRANGQVDTKYVTTDKYANAAQEMPAADAAK